MKFNWQARWRWVVWVVCSIGIPFLIGAAVVPWFTLMSASKVMRMAVWGVVIFTSVLGQVTAHVVKQGIDVWILTKGKAELKAMASQLLEAAEERQGKSNGR